MCTKLFEGLGRFCIVIFMVMAGSLVLVLALNLRYKLFY